MKNSNFIKNSIIALLPISLCIGVLFGVEFKDAKSVDAYPANRLTTMDIDLNDTADSDIRNYYLDLIAQSESERRGTNLLKNLKPILMKDQVYYSYDSTDSIWKLYEIIDRDWEKSPASEVLNGTYNSSTNIIENYTFRASEYLDDERNPYVHALYNDRSADNQTRVWGRDRATGKDTRHNQGQYGINREHIWAKSHGFDEVGDGVGGARGDPMHLWAADGYSNNVHNNHYFGYVDQTKSFSNTKNAEGFSYTGNNLLGRSKTVESGKTVFEPQDSDKGDIARALFYMVARYNNYAGETEGFDTNNPNLVLDNNINRDTGTSTWDNPYGMGVLTDLLEWNKIDPPDEFEIHRNNLLFKNFTNNRNPFIDFPEWADICFGDLEKTADPRTDLINGKSEDRTLVNLVITSNPSKTAYLEGETFSPKGMVVRANYSDGTHEEVKNYTYSPITTLTDDIEQIEISFEGKTINLPISVNKTTGEVAKYFEKVENIQENGSYLIVSEDAGAAWKEANGNSGHSIAYSLDGENIVYTDGLTNSLFGINFDTGYIQDSKGSYIGNDLDQTTLKTSKEPIENVVSLSDGYLDVSGALGAHLRCNPNNGNPIFKYYKSSSYQTQKPVSIYKLVVKQTIVVHPESIILDPTSVELELNNSLQISAKVMPTNAVNKEISWSSNKQGVVSVDENGQITALAAGIATITATAKDNGITATCVVTVPEPVILNHIEITGSYKRKFYVGDEYMNDGIVVTAYYTQGGITVGEEDVTSETEFDGFDSSEPGECIITASYNGKTATYNVTVNYIPVEENTSVFVMSQYGFDRGQTPGIIEKDGYIISFNNTASKYYDGSVRVYGNNTFTISGKNKIVAVSFVFGDGETAGKTLSVDSTVPCDPNTGEWHDTTGVEAITYKVASGSGQRRIEQIKVTYDPESHAEVKLSSISLNESCKKEFFIGEEFTYEGLRVTAHYTDSSSKVVSLESCSVSNPDMNVPGSQKIIVSYKEGGDTKQAQYSINIKRIVLTKLEIKGGTREFYLNGVFNHNGLNVTAYYNNGDTPDVSSLVTVSTPDLTSLGKKDVFVTFEDLVSKYEIEVIRDPDAPVELASSIYAIASENNWENAEKYENFDFDENVQISLDGEETGLYSLNTSTWNLSKGTKLSVESSGVYKITKFAVTYDSVSNAALFYQGKQILSNQEIELDQKDAVFYIGQASVTKGLTPEPELRIRNIEVVYIKGEVEPTVLTDIEIFGNYQTHFYQGEGFNYDGLVVKAYYSDGLIAEVEPDDVSGFVDEPGEHTITVSYEDKLKTYDVFVEAVVPTSIELTGSYQTDFFNNQEFNYDGLVVIATYNYGEPKQVQPTLVDGYDLSVLGPQTVTVHYGDLTAGYEITVHKYELSSISLSGTYQKQFYQNDEFNYDGLIVTAHYTDGSEKQVSNFTVLGYDKTKIGKQTISINYFEGGKSVNKTYEISVVENALMSIQLSGTYQKSFLKGAPFNSEGLVVTATYENGSTKVVAPTKIVGYNMNTVGEQEVSVIYTEGNKTVTAAYKINIIDIRLTEITISGNYPTTFEIGSNFSSQGLIVTAYYSNFTSEVVEPTSVSGYNMSVVGTQVVTVTYTENGVTLTATYNIVVKAKEEKKEEPKSNNSLPVIITVIGGVVAVGFAITLGAVFAHKKRKMRK